MPFWDWFKEKPPATTSDPATPSESGKLRRGKKHGSWLERDEKPRLRREGNEYVEIGYNVLECVYVDGVRHGPFTRRWHHGELHSVGTYVDGEYDGIMQVFDQAGEKLCDTPFRAGKLHGHYLAKHPNGALSYESDYIDGERQGAWKCWSEKGHLLEEGEHELGTRCGHWTVSNEDGVVLEAGSYIAGARDGAWILRAPGVGIEEGSFVNGEREGQWTVLRADGSIRACGEYQEGRLFGPWEAVSSEGRARKAREYIDLDELARWEKLEMATELLVAYEAEDRDDEAWVERAQAAIETLAQSWQVSAKKDKYGQTTISAPLGSAWQLSVALGQPLRVACHNTCWSQIVTALDACPPERREAAVSLAERAGLLRGFAPRDWLTAILENDDDADDPRARLASAFEPGRSFTSKMMERFRRRASHIEELSLRECAFPEGIAPLFEGDGYPAMHRLFIVCSQAPDHAVAGLIATLAKGTWLGKLRDLAIVETAIPGLADAQLAELFANPHLSALERLTLDRATLGTKCAHALAGSVAGASLRSIDLRDCQLEHAAIQALADLPALEELRLVRCTLPEMTARQVASLGSRTLRILKIEMEDWEGGYGVMRRLARVPALAKVELLDLSYCYLDELAARALARSPHLKALRKLLWASNAKGRESLTSLQKAAPNAEIVTSGGGGGVTIMDRSG